MFSNLKIKKKDRIIISVEIVILLKIDIISCIEAYLQIPWYNPKYCKRKILAAAYSRQKLQREIIKLIDWLQSNLNKRAIKKDKQKIAKSWSIVIKIFLFTLRPNWKIYQSKNSSN